MFKNFKLNRLLFFAPLVTLMFCFNAPQNDDEKMQTIMISVKNTLSYLHYSPKPINDAYSADVYDKYMEMIDPGKRFFLQSEVDEYHPTEETEVDGNMEEGTDNTENSETSAEVNGDVSVKNNSSQEAENE